MKIKVEVTEWSLRRFVKGFGNGDNVSMLPL